MSNLAITNSQLESRVPRAVVRVASEFEVASMREKWETLRDVAIALGLQLVFRATILLRRWNY
jgi:hypothetical protein